ncbi:nucleoside hydrolase [Cetobacterium sp. SF1]|uniref:nucleoside hydrolase n=1 Tax=unclassified Cetobacterium TaxID=2630983 RepID=UPI003CF701FD
MKKIIIDCDPGIDDAIALILAFSLKEIEIIGITISAGNVPVEIGAKNAFRVLKLLGKKDIPIYIGDNNPIKRKLVTAQDTHGNDGLGDILEEVPEIIANKNAWEFIVEILNSNENVDIIALGPLTNLAKAVKLDNKILNKANRIISMGGAYRTNGNCSQVAEFNYWVDPEAVNIVFNNYDKKIELIPLDVTRKIVLTPNYREYLKQINNNISKFIYDITGFYNDFHWKQERTLGCVINDPLAIAYYVYTELCEGFDSNLECVEEGIALGQSLIDSGDFYKREKNVYINTKVDSKKFFYLFFNSIFPEMIKDTKIIMEEY